VKSYYKDPQESASQVVFRSKTTNPGFFGYSLREIIACNLDARRQVVKTGRISRNKPGVYTARGHKLNFFLQQ
jgi:hypothetical protein